MEQSCLSHELKRPLGQLGRCDFCKRYLCCVALEFCAFGGCAPNPHAKEDDSWVVCLVGCHPCAVSALLYSSMHGMCENCIDILGHGSSHRLAVETSQNPVAPEIHIAAIQLSTVTLATECKHVICHNLRLAAHHSTWPVMPSSGTLCFVAWLCLAEVCEAVTGF